MIGLRNLKKDLHIPFITKLLSNHITIDDKLYLFCPTKGRFKHEPRWNKLKQMKQIK